MFDVRELRKWCNRQPAGGRKDGGPRRVSVGWVASPKTQTLLPTRLTLSTRSFVSPFSFVFLVFRSLRCSAFFRWGLAATRPRPPPPPLSPPPPPPHAESESAAGLGLDLDRGRDTAAERENGGWCFDYVLIGSRIGTYIVKCVLYVEQDVPSPTRK